MSKPSSMRIINNGPTLKTLNLTGSVAAGSEDLRNEALMGTTRFRGCVAYSVTGFVNFLDFHRSPPSTVIPPQEQACGPLIISRTENLKGHPLVAYLRVPSGKVTRQQSACDLGETRIDLPLLTDRSRLCRSCLDLTSHRPFRSYSSNR
jgi:hypothetical protein